MPKKLQLTVEVTVDDDFDEKNLSEEMGKALSGAVQPHIPIISAGSLRSVGKDGDASWTKITCDIFGRNNVNAGVIDPGRDQTKPGQDAGGIRTESGE